MKRVLELLSFFGMMTIISLWLVYDIRPLFMPSNTDASFQEEEKTDTIEAVIIKKAGYINVRTTYYNPVESQCDSTPLVTADGSHINKEKLKRKEYRWIAVSPDLLVEYPLGSKVKITSKKYPEISGIYEIHDVMNRRYRYAIDILSHEDNGHIFGTHLCKLEKA